MTTAAFVIIHCIGNKEPFINFVIKTNGLI